MIKYEDSELIQILPESVSKIPEVIAISYAIKKAIQVMVKYAGRISVHAAIDQLPENILDLLAVEYRSQYYEEFMPVEMKRDILKKTFLWFYQAGTPSAVEEMVESVFGTGKVQEWFDYNGKPYFFKIRTDAELNQESIAKFEKMITKVKNTRSHLEQLDFGREIKSGLYVCNEVITETYVNIGWGEQDGPIR